MKVCPNLYNILNKMLDDFLARCAKKIFGTILVIITHSKVPKVE